MGETAAERGKRRQGVRKRRRALKKIFLEAEEKMTENRELLINEAAELEDGKLDRLSAEVISLTRAAQKISLYYICEIGERLTEAKAIVGHGGWGEWLREKVNYSQSTAENFIKIYKEYGSGQTGLFGEENSETFEKLPYTKLLALTALDPESREEFCENNDVEAASVRELKDMIARLKNENEESARAASEKADELENVRREAAAAREAEADARREAEELKKEVDSLSAELDAANAQTAVPGFEEEKAELCEKYEKKLDKLKKELEKKKAAEEELRKKAEAIAAEIREKTAEEVRREAAEAAAAARAELEARCENAERKLSEAQKTDLSAISIYFEDVQRLMGLIRAELEKVRAADAAVYEKLSGGIKETMKKLSEVI